MTRKIFFFKTYTKNEAERLVPDLFKQTITNLKLLIQRYAQF